MDRARVQLNFTPLGHLHLYRLHHGEASYDCNNKFRDPVAYVVIRQEVDWLNFSLLSVPRLGNAQARLKAMGHTPQPTLIRSLPDLEVFIEIFSGSGRLASAVHKQDGRPFCGTSTLAQSMTCLHEETRVSSLDGCGPVSPMEGHVCTPCSSFARARDWRPGPPPLRSDSLPSRLPGLSDADQEKVLVGNSLFCAVCHYAYSLHMRESSYIQIMVVSTHARLCIVRVACRGKIYTLLGHLNLDCLYPCQCNGSKRGRCRSTGRAHIPLARQNAQVQWLTKVTEPCLKSSCRMFAVAFHHVHVCELEEEFGRHALPGSKQ